MVASTFRKTLVSLSLASGLVAGAPPQAFAHEAPPAEMTSADVTIESSGEKVRLDGLEDHTPVEVMDHHISHGGRPDIRAPVGIMGDHVQKKGTIMFAYRYKRMEMDGNRSGTDDISTADVLERFMVAPTNMTMEMHMFGLMYGLSDDANLMVMVPYIEKSMDHVTRTGVRFTTGSEGVGDVTLAGLFKLFDNGSHRLHLNAGLSFPTGSIDERDATPADPNARLPYPMQIGSGTYDLLPGITYTGFSEEYSWGAQASGTVRLGENDRSYTFGNRLNLTAWGARPLTGWLSASLRVAWRAWEDVDGADPALNPAMVQTADPDRQSGQRVDLIFGINALLPSGPLKRNQLGVEIGVPGYQDLDGPQLETDWTVAAGWRVRF